MSGAIPLLGAVVEIEAIRSPAERFHCKPYHAVIAASTCVLRQRAMDRGSNPGDAFRGGVSRFENCVECPDGQAVAKRVGDEVPLERTVSCSICGEFGHNRQSCPRRGEGGEVFANRDEALAKLEKDIEERRARRARGELPVSTPEVPRDEKLGARMNRCGKCGQPGHKATTCGRAEPSKTQRVRLPKLAPVAAQAAPVATKVATEDHESSQPPEVSAATVIAKETARASSKAIQKLRGERDEALRAIRQLETKLRRAKKNRARLDKLAELVTLDLDRESESAGEAWASWVQAGRRLQVILDKPKAPGPEVRKAKVFVDSVLGPR